MDADKTAAPSAMLDSIWLDQAREAKRVRGQQSEKTVLRFLPSKNTIIELASASLSPESSR